ncbi:MAG TPA: alpha/beta hydrolase [Rhodopila sp.]|jgi:pimeloyl-ACP methyl ester carboxylesterase
MSCPRVLGLAVALVAAVIGPARADPIYGAELQGFAYPWPVAHFLFTSQGEALDMAYMDIRPAHPNGQAAVLLHGKNFCSATWQTTIARLSGTGYRVIAPDQIGFCKSTKPAHYQYSFQQLAGNTQALLASLGIGKATVIGHSTGGMLAIRYGLMYPDAVDRLVLVDPVGLEDWKAKGVPWQSVDTWFQQELHTSAQRIRDYERGTYYAGTWRPNYETWVEMLAGLNLGPGHRLVAWNSALIYDMLYTQPVVYELGALQMPVLLMVGDRDTTAIGKDFAPAAIRRTLGNYAALGKEAASRIPHATLVEFPALGHAPQIQDPNAFHQALLDYLRKPASGGD